MGALAAEAATCCNVGIRRCWYTSAAAKAPCSARMASSGGSCMPCITAPICMAAKVVASAEAGVPRSGSKTTSESDGEETVEAGAAEAAPGGKEARPAVIAAGQHEDGADQQTMIHIRADIVLHPGADHV